VNGGLARVTRRWRRGARLPDPLVVAGAFVVGAVPFSNVAARRVAGVDLRSRGTGTVSGTALYEVAGFKPLAVAGSLDVAKGAVGPLLAGRRRRWLGAIAAAAAIGGHNWSPWLDGAGGRGLSPALGATLVLAPEGTVVLGLGLGLGRLVRQTGLGCFVALIALFAVLGRRHGIRGVFTAVCVAGPILAKRVLGNDGLASVDPKDRPRVMASRLLFDRDTFRRPAA
jgi:glycerol-3-phosphate acyltransferase PlsY